MELHDTPTASTAGRLLGAGGVLLLVGNMLHPVDDLSSATSRFSFASEPTWVPLHLAVGLGFVLVATGLVLYASAVARRRPRSAASATMLSVTAIVGGGLLATVFIGLDGFAVSSLQQQWASADAASRVAVEGAAIALEAVDSGLAGTGTLLLLGVAMLGLASTLRHSAASAWLVAAASLTGVLGTITGGALLVAGPTTTTINLLLRPAAGGMTLTVLALGVVLARRTSAPVRDGALSGRGSWRSAGREG